jgi:hypothetical protein
MYFIMRLHKGFKVEYTVLTSWKIYKKIILKTNFKLQEKEIEFHLNKFV